MDLAPAKYLLRFDDLCPTMAREPFRRFMALVEQYRIQPILAVVPDNHDPELNIDNPDPDFWRSMRDLESAGATIALHGYRHVCRSRGSSFLRMHSQTEFAGVPEGTQAEWIHSGLDILRQNGLSPRLFVAPRHGFDSATLRALVRESLPSLSDGFAARPFTRGDVVWIPQQLWEPVEKPHGLWTICLHTNTATQQLQRSLHYFLHRFADQFTSLDKVVSDAAPVTLRFTERVREALTVYRMRLRSAFTL
jgi:hypothetical protein